MVANLIMQTSMSEYVTVVRYRSNSYIEFKLYNFIHLLAQYSEEERVCDGRVCRRPSEFPTDLQVWRGNTHIRHKVCIFLWEPKWFWWLWHYLYKYFLSVCLSVLRKGNLLGQTESCGVSEGRVPLCRPIMRLCSGVWPHGLVGPPGSRSAFTAVTWATLLATTNLSLPFSLCMWDKRKMLILKDIYIAAKWLYSCSKTFVSPQFPFKLDLPLVELEVEKEWTKVSDATTKFSPAPGFQRSSWDWVGLYKVRNKVYVQVTFTFIYF